MNNYIDFNARHVAALLLIRAKSGINPAVLIPIKRTALISMPKYRYVGCSPSWYIRHLLRCRALTQELSSIKLKDWEE